MGSPQLTILLPLLLVFTLSSVLSLAKDSADIGEKKLNLGEREEALRRFKKQINLSNDKYTDAAYAGKFAFMLKDLESQNKEVYTNFISSGFEGEDVPRELPPQIRSLSRISSQPQLATSNNFITTNSIQSIIPERAQRVKEAQFLNGRESAISQRQNSQFPSFAPSQFPPRQLPPIQLPPRQIPPRQFTQRQSPLRQAPLNRDQPRPAFRRPVPFRRLRL